MAGHTCIKYEEKGGGKGGGKRIDEDEDDAHQICTSGG